MNPGTSHCASSPQGAVEASSSPEGCPPSLLSIYALQLHYLLCCSHLDVPKDVSNFFLKLWSQNCTQYLKWEYICAKYIGRITSFDQMAVLCLMQSKMPFALLAASARYWLTLILLSPTPHVHFSWAALQPLISRLCLWIVLFNPRCRSQHFLSLNFMMLLIIQCSNVSSSLCMASHPSRQSSAPSSLVSSANLLRMHSNPLLIKCWTELTPELIPVEHLLWLSTSQMSPHSLQPFELSVSQFITQHSAYLFILLLENLSRRMESKSLLKFRKILLIVFAVPKIAWVPIQRASQFCLVGWFFDPVDHTQTFHQCSFR